MIKRATRTAVLANLGMQILKNFLTSHGQLVSLQVKLYRVLVS